MSQAPHKWREGETTAGRGAEITGRLALVPCGHLQHQGGLRESLDQARPRHAVQRFVGRPAGGDGRPDFT